MMKDTRIKNIFFISSALLLVMMLLTSRDAGISCDEVIHYNHSVSVYNYFATHGADQSALNTPVSHLKYYGQSYDNLVTILTRWFNIKDVYGFRNLMSSLMGWLTIIITALFAVWLKNYRTGLLVLFLFAVSPTFLGHSQNNLKDIPFAFAYIAGTFFILKFLFPDRKAPFRDKLFLLLSIAFCISIRAGGLLLICYLILFFMISYILKFFTENNFNISEATGKLSIIAVISAGALLLSITLWPYARQNPFTNIIQAYRVMAHYPDTFRQIFEGKVEWSDYMPWYYILKSMGITIPVLVLSGLMAFLILLKKIFSEGKSLLYLFILFTIIFPILFVILKKSNLYSSWRQFLFLYPGIILLAAAGISCLFELVRKRYLAWILIIILGIISVHPVKYMIFNHPYEYMYYNQLVGGLKGAYANYETDYYFVSQTEASAWLIDYLEQKNVKGPVKVKATYSVQWQFRNNPEIETSFFRYEERSQLDWDYAIVVSRYLTPYQLNNKLWPPRNSIHVIYADSIPVCAVLERKSKNDYYGYSALSEGKYSEAVNLYEKVFKVDDGDEMIFYNFAAALYNSGQYQKADSVLKKSLELNPDFEPVLMYMGNIERARNNTDKAISYYERVIKANRKYFEAYVGLAGLLKESDLMKARSLLRTCLKMNPGYKPAVIALADTYRNTNPEIARKYDDLAKTIK
jgi:tetratricopeptide (TPR) repeat protein